MWCCVGAQLPNLKCRRRRVTVGGNTARGGNIMKKTASPLAVLAMAIVLGGCAIHDEFLGVFTVNDVVQQEAAVELIYTADGKKVDLGGDKFKGHYKDAAICESLPDTTGNAAAHFKCRVARNKILNQWMALSDRVCEKHLGAVQGNSTLINVGSGFITIVTSTLATFVGAGATPQALSAAAAISSATGTLANEQIYLQQVVPVLTSKIRTNRREIGDRQG